MAAALQPKDRTAVRSLAARMRAAARNKPLLLTGRSAKAAAEAMAADLRLGAYRVDLSAIVGKFIGETEKNLDRVFDQAEGASVLIFEEADVLFGKRSEVKDSHDRYANIVVSYLLARAEARRGIVILVSDTQRRLPQAATRRLSILAFPPL